MPSAAMLLLILLVSACVAGAGAPVPPDVARPDPANIQRRGALANARLRFEREHKGHVAFIGGSITEMNGYRPMVMDVLKRRFPDTAFTFTDAGIASTCSNTGAFRLADHVLSKGPVDLFFVEFAVNDDQDAAYPRRECLRGMEGIVRHTRLHNPKADIVLTYFVNPGMLKLLQEGKTPVPIDAHEAVARHYQCSTIHLAREVAERIQAGKLTWKVYGGTHPKPAGNRICAAMIDALMAQAWKDPLREDAKPAPYPMPEPLDPLSYFRGRFLPLEDAKLKDGWTLGVPPWKTLKGGCRARFVDATMLSTTEPGSELTLAFAGTAVGAYVLAGPDAGLVETSIDGAAFRRVDLYHRFSRGLHYPRTVVFAADLAPGKHTLVLRLSIRENPDSKGDAARILHFVAN